ncbi:rCG47030 [Rattus norvegicus]|uniref:RCG47030 n=1 Tax=Rattus norvegicus TaxID=10116 RepID=A6KUI9_RAT|nr:rCG47030 [Rattus norvegicus]
MSKAFQECQKREKRKTGTGSMREEEERGKRRKEKLEGLEEVRIRGKRKVECGGKRGF